MARLTGEDVNNAVNTFLGTYFAARRDRRDEEDRADERRYREFYMKLAADQDARSAETHTQNLESGRLQLEAVQRDASASAAILEQYGKTLEQMTAENAAEALPIARELHRISLEQARLQSQTSQYMLDTYYPAQVASMEASTARQRQLASGGVGGGGAGDVGGVDLMEQYKQMAFQQRTIEDRLDRYKNSMTGEIDWDRVDPPLMHSYFQNSQAMADLEAAMIPAQRALLGLGPGSGTDGPGSSEAEEPVVKTPEEARLHAVLGPPPSERRAANVEQQKSTAAARNKQTNLSNRRWVIVNPNDGTLTATDDPKIADYARAWGEKRGNQAVFHAEEVPAHMIGKSAERWRHYEKAPGLWSRFGLPLFGEE